MRNTILLVILFFSSMLSFSQTQAEMNIEAAKEYKKANQEMNSIYQQVIKEYKADTLFIKNLKKAQKIWIQFRDAEMAAKYPHPYEYGSIFPTCYSMELTGLTEERTKKLKVWLTGIEEGDVCAGSVKIKQ